MPLGFRKLLSSTLKMASALQLLVVPGCKPLTEHDHRPPLRLGWKASMQDRDLSSPFQQEGLRSCNPQAQEA